VIAALFLATLAVYAQSNATDGALDGYVLDESGAVIPGAKIVVRNVQTNIELTANADRQGYFRFPLLRVRSSFGHLVSGQERENREVAWG
jgi:hypothetical protein